MTEEKRKFIYAKNGLNEKGLPIESTPERYKVPTTEENENFFDTNSNGGKISAQEIINRIEDVKENFENENNITNWNKESPSRFSAFCLRVGSEVFANGRKNLLKVEQTETNIPNRKYYDVNLLEDIYTYFKYLCNNYDVPVRVSDFADFTGMRTDVIYHKSQNLTSSIRAFYQKIQADNETSLESVGIGGKRNSLVIMASLNHRHGWNKDITPIETSEKSIEVQELPKLGQKTE